jgi:hypothetical protein
MYQDNNKNMPKKIKTTTTLTKKQIFIIVFCFILFIIIIGVTNTLLQKQPATSLTGGIPTPIPGQGTGMTPIVEKTAVLHLEQQPNNTINVVVDSGKGAISAVQLQLSYDPQVLSNVTIHKGGFFVNPIELQNATDSTAGILNYAIAISPTSAPQQGNGVIATISYTPAFGVANPTKIAFLPGTKVTAEGIDESVLQLPQPFNLNISQ